MSVLVPKGQRLSDLLTGTIDLLRGAEASPLELASFSGILSWHNLLNRPLFSCLHILYTFTQEAEEKKVRTVPKEVVDEGDDVSELTVQDIVMTSGTEWAAAGHPTSSWCN